MVKLTIDLTNEILAFLAKQPFGQVAPLIDKIRREAIVEETEPPQGDLTDPSA